MYALSALAEEESKKELYNDYVGQGIWIISTMIAGIAGKESPLPQYIELMHPETKKPEETAEEIKARILKRLTE